MNKRKKKFKVFKSIYLGKFSLLIEEKQKQESRIKEIFIFTKKITLIQMSQFTKNKGVKASMLDAF